MGISERQRIAYVDAAKGLSILMIMMGHVTDYYNPLDMWMSSFKVSIFYVISGFLMCYTGSVVKRSFTEFTGKILKSLAIPYLYFSIIGIVFKTGCVFLKHKPQAKVSDTFWRYLWDSVFLKGMNSMWFLPTLFIGELIFFWLIRRNIVVKIIYGVVALFAVSFANIVDGTLGRCVESSAHVWIYEDAIRLTNAVCKGIVAAWFIGAGYLMYSLYRHIDSLQFKAVLGIILSIVNLVLSQINEGVDFNCMKDGRYPFMFYICGIIGSAGAIILLDVITGYVKLGFLDFWGKNSLIVMCTHTVLGFRTLVYKGWASVGYMPKTGSFEYICHCFVVLAILLLIEYSLVVIINDRFPFLIGKEKVKTSKN